MLGDAGEALGDSLYEAKLYVRGSVTSLGADCIEKEMRDEHRKDIAEKLAAAGLAGEVDPSEFPPLRLGPLPLPLPRRQRRSLLMAEHPKDPSKDPRETPRTKPRTSATFTPEVMSEIRRAAATGIYDIRGAGAKRALPHFDDLLFLGASISRYRSKATVSAAAPRWCWAAASPRSRST